MPTEARSLLADLRSTFRSTVAELASVPEARMLAENAWGGKPVDVRFFFLRFADHEEEHHLQVENLLAEFGFRQSTAQRILGAAEATHGELYGALVGLTDDDLDVAPETPVGEWPLRRTLVHVIHSELSYIRNTTHAIELARAGRPWERPEMVEPEVEDRTLDGFIERLDAVRDMTLDALAQTEDAVLTAPTEWWQYSVDVRFRLMRFAHHQREHTAHILKWRRQTGRVHTEAQFLLANAWKARGVTESVLVGVPDDLLDRAPADGGWTIRKNLEHLGGTHGYLLRQITAAQ
jgi:uncharacterized damage-inducible protein DinB